MFHNDSFTSVAAPASTINPTFAQQGGQSEEGLGGQISNSLTATTPGSHPVDTSVTRQFDSTCDSAAILPSASSSARGSPTQQCEDGEREASVQLNKAGLPKPPKKPLTPYMGFSKAVWQQVKLCNPGLTVCQVGTTIGRLWRELSEEERQKYNAYFHLDKTRYDVELKAYLSDNGLQPSDLVKPRAKRVKKSDSDTPKSKRGSSAVNHAGDSKSVKDEESVTKQLQGETASVPTDTSSTGNYSLPHFAQLWDQSNGNGFINPDGKTDTTPSESSTTLSNEQQQLLLIQQIQQQQLLQQQLAQQQQQLAQQQSSQQQQQPAQSQPQTQQAPRQQGLVVYHIRSDGTPECFFQNTGGVFDVPSVTDTQPASTLQNAVEQNALGNQWQGSSLPPSVAARMVAQPDNTELMSLRADLAEKCQEVNRLMEQLGEAYGLIRQLKQQNDFYHQHWSTLMQQQQQPQQQQPQQHLIIQAQSNKTCAGDVNQN